MKLIATVVLIALAISSCQSGDKKMQICEQNNTECQQNCVITNANFSHTRLATQPVGICDQRCEKTYQDCIKRQENRSLKGISDY